MHTDKLISRIKAVLNGDTGHFEIQSLALEYADRMMHVRDRLDQCVTLIRAGNDYAALQVAESAPPLLDTAAQLSFAESPDWIALCRERNVPWPSPLDQRQVDLVSGLYGRQISESHPLYRDYRQAIREHDELRALAVLASIIRINPEDRNARSELARLAEKARDTHFRRLDTLLDTGDHAAAFALAEALERISLPAFANAPALQRVRALRETQEREKALQEALDLIHQTAPLREKHDWQNAIPLLGRCRALEHNHQLVFDDDTARELAELEQWAGQHQEEHNQKLARQEAIRLATQALRAATTQRADTRVSRARLKQHSLELQLAIDTAGRFAGEIEQALLDDAKTLFRRVNRRINQRDILLVSSVAGILALLVCSGLALQKYQSRVQLRDEAVQQMTELPQRNRLREAEAYLANLGARWNSHPEFAEARRALTQWTNGQRAKVDTAVNAVDRLAEFPAGTATPDGLQSGFTALASLKNDTASLPVDLREEFSRKLDAAEAHLTEVREKLRGEHLPAFTRQLDELDNRFSNARALSRTADRLQAIESLQPALTQINDTGKHISFILPDELATRWQTLANTVADATVFWRQTVRTEQALAGARTLENYFEVIKANVEKNDLLALLLRNEAALKNPAEKLLTPDAYQLWQVAATLPANATPFLPAEIQPGEAVDAARLTQNKIFERLFRYTLRTLPSDPATPDTTIFTVGQVRTERLPIGDGYELRQSADVLQPNGTSENKIFSMRQFGGRIARGETLVDGFAASESRFLSQFSRFYDPSTGRITEPLLSTLDRIRNTFNISPLLKAYLQQEILKIADSRPAEWGLLFSPTARNDIASLQQLTQGAVTANDWINPVRWTDRLPALQQHYAPPQYSYLNEALAYLRVFQRLARPGFVFVGHVTAEKKLRLVTQHVLAGSLAGINQDGRLVLLPLADVLGDPGPDDTDTLRTLRDSVPFAPYSPVLMLGINPADAAVLVQFPEGARPPADGWQNFVFQKTTRETTPAAEESSPAPAESTMQENS